MTRPARFRAMLAADMELGAGNVLLRLARLYCPQTLVTGRS